MKHDINKIEESRKSLLEELKPGDTVYTVLRHVSKSGMLRRIDCYVFRDGRPRFLTYHAAVVTGRPIPKWGEEGIKMGGFGMDMGFSLVYSLSCALFPDGFACIGKDGCPSNDHVNGKSYRKGKHHKEGGYALRHAWL